MNTRMGREFDLLSPFRPATGGNSEAAELLQSLADEALRLTDSVGAAIALGDGDERALTWRALAGVCAQRLELGARAADPALDRAARTGRVVAIDDAADDPLGGGRLAAEAGISPVAAVPIRIGDRSIGAISIRRPLTAPPYGTADRAIVEAIAERAAAVLAGDDRPGTAETAALIPNEKLSALARLSAGVAHNFNNLLATILGNAELLAEGPTLEHQNARLQAIIAAAIDGGNAVRRLQEFSRERRHGTFRPVDLAAVARSAIEIAQTVWRDQAELEGRRITVSNRITEPIVVFGDESSLREVVTNLILNAAEAIPASGSIVLDARVVDREVCLCVRDNGHGMTAEVRARLFEPFFTTRPSGSGLGLASSFGIVQHHGGRIEVESAPGQGTAVEVWLPRPADDRRPAAGPAEPISATHCRILLVDDEPELVTMFGLLLEQDGHQVRLCPSGEAAIAALQAEEFDLVITDLIMPEYTGWDVAAAAKRRRPDLPVILMTGWETGTDADPTPADRIDAILPKPARLRDVRRTIANLTRR